MWTPTGTSEVMTVHQAVAVILPSDRKAYQFTRKAPMPP
jgi:hypothetical protein